VDFLALLRRLFVVTPPEMPPRRLSEAQAISLAKEAAADHWLRDKLSVATAQRNEHGAVVWNVVTGGVGSHLSVVIDDASGAVLELRSFEGR
jgi:hypothetical protein